MRIEKMALLAGALAVLVAAPTFGQAVAVDASALNVRTGPGTSNSKILVVHRGEVYPTVATSGSWTRIDLGGREGWSHSGYLRSSSAPVQTVTAGRLNVRSGPSTRYRTVGSLPRGARVAVIGTSGSWRKISHAGRLAWVHGNYLTAGGPSSPPPTSPTRPTSSAGYIQLAASGPGFHSYAPSNRRWGTPKFIYGIERVALRWQRERPRGPRIGVGDISYQNGGPISGHASHQLGVDGDFRPLRGDGREDPVTIHQSAYSRTDTQRVLDFFVDELPVRYIFFNDTRTRHTQTWPNHDNHFHVRIWP